MRGLILDTSREQAVIGAITEATVETTQLIEGGKGLSSSLLPALASHIDGIEYIAVGVGPGSYMGVRTGAALAKALAFSKNLPLIPFSSLLISLPPDLSTPFLFVGDAKMGEVFLVAGSPADIQRGELPSPKFAPKTTWRESTVFDGRKLIGPELPAPHLYWVNRYVQTALSKKKFSTPEALTLQYIR